MTFKLSYHLLDHTLFVITVAPQNDICPHGRTYPRKAVAIVTKKIRTPIDHV
jgi:hypothetical protein